MDKGFVMEKFLCTLLLLVLCPLHQIILAETDAAFFRMPSPQLGLWGLPSFGSTPARSASPGFGLRCYSLRNVDEVAAEASGELALSSARLSFLYEYTYLDSLYRRSYTEMDFSWAASRLVLGAAYGYSMEWIPGADLWGRHRYKLGASYTISSLNLGGMVVGWTDEFSEALSSVDFLLGVSLMAGQGLLLFGEWDGSKLDMGSSVRLGFIELKSAYRLPGFGLSLSLVFWFGGNSVEGQYGFSGESWRWFGLGLTRRIQKKTIL